MTDEKEKKFKQLVQDLGEVASRDEYISDEEFSILKQVSFDLIKYDKALKNALEDGVITTHEQLQLNNLQAQIEKNVVSVADADHKISEDEAMLIKKLAEIMKQYF
ncbi:MAG: hypothetical protein GPJ54_13710 [Candidatus Heimdallarchaeota archaeon]|nr:hypothetical protein [Candidatus Heimdallarchaeota archaeon]